MGLPTAARLSMIPATSLLMLGPLKADAPVDARGDGVVERAGASVGVGEVARLTGAEIDPGEDDPMGPA